MSSTQQTITRLRELKLVPMADAYDMQLQQPKLHDVSFDDRFAMLVDYEASEREARKLKRLIRGAGMPEAASFEDVEYKVNRGLDKAQLASLASCDWIRRQQNLIIQGATGVGKTWLACAFGQQACRLKMPVLFYRASDLYGTINQSLLDGSLPALKLSLSNEQPDFINPIQWKFFVFEKPTKCESITQLIPRFRLLFQRIFAQPRHQA